MYASNANVVDDEQYIMHEVRISSVKFPNSKYHKNIR